MTATAPRPSEARERLLGTATGLFYAKGIHTVGINEVLAESRVTRATLYRHFPGKDDLVVAYLTAADLQQRAHMASIVDSADGGSQALHDVAVAIAEQINSPGFRGCAFLNAITEFPDAGHPVHEASLRQRAWFLDLVTEQLRLVADTDPDPAARHFVMLRDGAMVSGCIADPVAVGETFVRGVDGLLAVRVEHSRAAGSRELAGE